MIGKVILGLGLIGLWDWWRNRHKRGTSREVGIWAGSSALANPGPVAAECQRWGINHIDVMVQDGSKPGSPFTLADEGRIRAAVRLWQAAGLEVSLTSWVAARPDWVAGLERVARLARELGCGLTLDAEEAWSLGVVEGRSLRTHSDAVIDSWAAQVFAAIGRGGLSADDVAVTVIVSAELRVFLPLVRRAGCVVPQSYATVKNAGHRRIGADGVTGSLEAAAATKWAPHSKRLVLGCAVWNLDGAYGLTDDDAGAQELRASLVAARALGRGIRIWSLTWLRGNTALQGVLAAWAAGR